MNEKALFYDCNTGEVLRCVLLDGNNKKEWWVITPDEKCETLAKHACGNFGREKNFRLLAMDGEKTSVQSYLKLLWVNLRSINFDVFTDCTSYDREFRRLGCVVDDETPITLKTVISAGMYDDDGTELWDILILDEEGLNVFYSKSDFTWEEIIKYFNDFKSFIEKKLKNVTFAKPVIEGE